MNYTPHRIEKDSLGPVPIPEQAYFGPQTARGIANFTISGIHINRFDGLIHALAQIKMAGARANAALGDLEAGKADLIVQVCEEILAGRHTDQFPLDVFQGGAGTSVNMNMNEVIANRGLEIMGLARGRYESLHPNDDVNLSQSTNDVYPSAIRLALLYAQEPLRLALTRLIAALEDRADTFAEVIKLGRTQLQDAVPMTLGQEFRAFATALRLSAAHLDQDARGLLEINLGGTAIGTGINARPDYQAAVLDELRHITGLALTPAHDLIEASWDTGTFVRVSGALKHLALQLSKICNDLRLLSSGPRGGLNEINLPALQPGSSIMPGKVNPVIPEVVNQVAFQIMGQDLTVCLAAEAGQLQLNVMEPVIAYNLLHGMSLMTGAVDALCDKCVMGITANPDFCRGHLEAGAAIATALTPVIGYERAAMLAKQVLASDHSIAGLIAQDPDLARDCSTFLEDFQQLTRPMRLEHVER